MTKINTDKFYECLSKNSLNKNTTTESGKEISYSNFNNKDFLMSKVLKKEENSVTTNITLYYNKKSESIIGELSLRGLNTNNKYGIYLIYGNYNIETKKFECKINQDGGFKPRCNILLKESKEFTKEINNLIKSCGVNTKYVSKKAIDKKN